MTTKCLEDLVLMHDRRVREEGRSIWLGSEPTFTDRYSNAPEWLSEALGEDKEARARQLLGLLRDRHPGAVVLRTVGRQYAGEPQPRWSYGLYSRRDQAPLWAGPPDWLEDHFSAPLSPAGSTAELCDALRDELRTRSLHAARVACPGPRVRLVFRNDGTSPCSDPTKRPELLRESIHSLPLPLDGVQDALSAAGEHLVVLQEFQQEGGRKLAQVELPAFARVADFIAFLDVLAAAANRVGLDGLVLSGFPPPVDATVAWTTLTPDPAVLEVNQAPAIDLETHQRWMELLYELAEQVGLSPYRLAYDGTVSDSGGGGQITFGGPTPLESPFFVAPRLLPRLLRYLVRHPALSFWFATHYVGGSSQSPRPDEGSRDAFAELGLALDELARTRSVTPDILWGTLRHFLADGTGNPHRSELNIEKLYNPYLHDRGCLGLVEFRALRMASTAERSTAQALLMRSIVAMLMGHDVVPDLVDWGDALHDRFALPSELRADLADVFSELEAHGWELGQEAQRLLLSSDERQFGCVELDGATLRVEQAIEFWPLVGDAASQEVGGSRLVDSSTHRLELCLMAPEEVASDWGVSVSGYCWPPKRHGMGVRFRAFSPFMGLHPTVAPVPHVDICLHHHPTGRQRQARLHLWKPDGSAYDGLPRSLEESMARRHERLVVEEVTQAKAFGAKTPPPAALSEFCLDLRRLYKRQSHVR